MVVLPNYAPPTKDTPRSSVVKKPNDENEKMKQLAPKQRKNRRKIRNEKFFFSETKKQVFVNTTFFSYSILPPPQRCRSILSKFGDTYNPSPGFFFSDKLSLSGIFKLTTPTMERHVTERQRSGGGRILYRIVFYPFFINRHAIGFQLIGVKLL